MSAFGWLFRAPWALQWWQGQEGSISRTWGQRHRQLLTEPGAALHPSTCTCKEPSPDFCALISREQQQTARGSSEKFSLGGGVAYCLVLLKSFWRTPCKYESKEMPDNYHLHPFLHPSLFHPPINYLQNHFRLFLLCISTAL